MKKNCMFEATLTGEVLHLVLCGEIDHHSAVAIRTEMDERIMASKPKKTVLDLSGIEFMDSSGLGLIMGRFALMQRLGGELTLKSPNERLMKIFDLAGLWRMVRIEEEGEEDKQ